MNRTQYNKVWKSSLLHILHNFMIFFWWVGEGVPVLHWRWRWPNIGFPRGLFIPWVMVISGIVTKWWTNLLVVIRIVCRDSAVRFEACQGISDFFYLVKLRGNHVSGLYRKYHTLKLKWLLCYFKYIYSHLSALDWDSQFRGKNPLNTLIIKSTHIASLTKVKSSFTEYSLGLWKDEMKENEFKSIKQISDILDNIQLQYLYPFPSSVRVFHERQVILNLLNDPLVVD